MALRGFVPYGRVEKRVTALRDTSRRHKINRTNMPPMVRSASRHSWFMADSVALQGVSDDLLRVAIAAHLARYRGLSRAHTPTPTCRCISVGVPNTASTR